MLCTKQELLIKENALQAQEIKLLREEIDLVVRKVFEASSEPERSGDRQPGGCPKGGGEAEVKSSILTSYYTLWRGWRQKSRKPPRPPAPWRLI